MKKDYSSCFTFLYRTFNMGSGATNFMGATSKHILSTEIFPDFIHLLKPMKSVAMLDIRGTTAPKPVKTVHTSTTITTGTVHHKEARGGTSHVHHFREVTTIILLIIRISIQTNLPLENLFLAKLKSTKI